MADSDILQSSAPGPDPAGPPVAEGSDAGSRFGRRAVLGSAAGASAALLAGAGTAAAAPHTGPASGTGAADRPAADRHIHYRCFTGAGLRDGAHDGTRWSDAGIQIWHPTGGRDYADPFAEDQSQVRYDTAAWTSPVVPTPFDFTELIASWEARTPGRTWVEITVRGTDETGTRTGWYVLGRWCADDPADGGAIHRTSVDGQGTDIATVWTDTLHVHQPHALSDWQLRVTLLRPAGSHHTPVLQAVGAV